MRCLQSNYILPPPTLSHHAQNCRQSLSKSPPDGLFGRVTRCRQEGALQLDDVAAIDDEVRGISTGNGRNSKLPLKD
jgi:hypothetical protein